MIRNTYVPECFQPENVANVANRYVQETIKWLYIVNTILAIAFNINAIIIRMRGRGTAHTLRRGMVIISFCEIGLVTTMPFASSNFVLSEWLFPGWLCPTIQIIQLALVFIIRMTHSVIAIERWLAIAHPFSEHFEWIKEHSKFIFVGIGLCSFVYVAIPVTTTRLMPFTFRNETYHQCVVNYGSVALTRLFLALNFGITFVISFTAIIFSGIIVTRKMIEGDQMLNQVYGHGEGGRAVPGGQAYQMRPMGPMGPMGPRASAVSESIAFGRPSYKKANWMIFWTITVDFILWLPVKTINLLSTFDVFGWCSEGERTAIVTAYIIFHFMAAFSSLATPILHLYTTAHLRRNTVNFWRDFFKRIRVIKSETSIPTVEI